MGHALMYLRNDPRYSVFQAVCDADCEPDPIPVQFPDWVRDDVLWDTMFRVVVTPTGRLGRNRFGLDMVEVAGVEGFSYFALLHEVEPL